MFKSEQTLTRCNNFLVDDANPIQLKTALFLIEKMPRKTLTASFWKIIACLLQLFGCRTVNCLKNGKIMKNRRLSHASRQLFSGWDCSRTYQQLFGGWCKSDTTISGIKSTKRALVKCLINEHQIILRWSHLVMSDSKALVNASNPLRMCKWPIWPILRFSL